MSDTEAEVTERRQISKVWIVPIVAVLLGAWMVYFTFTTQGPKITVVFSTAEGIEAGKTKIKARSVEVGLVESVGLGEDLESVEVVAQLEKFATPLLREDTQFWVVRPRIGAGGISGLGTIVSGGYIELAPGEGEPGRREFRGLEDVPVTPVGTPGLQFSLYSEQAGSVTAGDPILYKGFEVGRVESTDFDVEGQHVHYGAFIDAPYDDLVTSNTRFWNASGVHFSATADGIELETGSLQSMLFGGVAFGLPEGVGVGSPVEHGASFELYADFAEVNQRPYRHGLEYVVQFARSVRGLRPGAPVEWRGIPIGKVERLLMQEMVSEGGMRGQGAPIAVLLRLEPGRLTLPDSEDSVAAMRRTFEVAVQNGARATLATGSLLTGSRFIAFDMYPNEPHAEVGEFAGWPTIPTISTGLEGIEVRVADLLDKLNSLPLERMVASADGSLRELRRTLAEVRTLVASEDVQTLPRNLDTTLAELERTLQSVEELARTLEDRPSSLIFATEPEPDPEPKAGPR
jgi:paraquat-inducible protein B